jgi:hypothetical protein
MKQSFHYFINCDLPLFSLVILVSMIRTFATPNYCIVSLTVGQNEAASFIRRFLKHPALHTQSKRKGKVVRLTHTGMRIWQLHAEKEDELVW